jgi:hypothetical protein
VAYVKDLYFDFVVKRHAIWEKRQRGEPSPWTADPFLWRKYTNVFRVLDPGSQYVVEMMQDAPTPADALARAFLYRYTNKPETWDYLKERLGRWPLASDIDAELYAMMSSYRDAGNTLFSGAYIIMPAPNTTGDKAMHAVALAKRLMHPESPQNVVEQVVGATTQRAAFDALTAHLGVGDFMAMQVLTDWGYYWSGWDENTFVVAGPGSKRGIAHISKDKPEDFIREIQQEWYLRIDCPSIPLPGGLERAPSLMDIQNTFCEFSKYMRYLSEPKKPSVPYKPAHPGPQPEPNLPTHWWM